MKKTLKNFSKDEKGATAIEYGLIAALVSISLIAALSTFSDSIGQLFGRVTTAIIANMPAGNNNRGP